MNIVIELEKIFELSLSGFFIMTIEEPIVWNDSIDKDALLDYVFENQRITKVNKVMLDQYGSTEKEFLNKTPNELFAHDLSQGRQAWMQLFDEGKLHVNTLEQKADGTEMWIEGDYVCIYDSEGRIIGHFGNQIDVTEKKNIEEELMLSLSKLDGIVNSAMDAIISVNSKQEIAIFNPAAEKMFGYALNDIIGKPLETLIPMQSKNHHQSQVSNYGKTGVSNRMMYGAMGVNGLKSNGDIFPIEVSISQIEIKGEKLYTAIIRDITDRKKTELALIEAKIMAEESDRLKSAFLSNISHEIRTPLNGIIGFISLLQDETLSDEDRNEYLQIIEKSGYGLVNIMSDILDTSKLEAGISEVMYKQVNINEKLNQIYKKSLPSMARNIIEFNYVLGLDDAEADIITDREKLFIALQKLLDNAIKFTKNGKIEIGYKLKEKNLEFYVSDTGIGIPSTMKDTIFEKFRQVSETLSRDFDGAGLGLSIAKSYVELIGGKIWVESEFGKGSTFYISVPYVPANIYSVPLNTNYARL